MQLMLLCRGTAFVDVDGAGDRWAVRRQRPRRSGHLVRVGWQEPIWVGTGLELDTRLGRRSSMTGCPALMINAPRLA